MHPSYHVKHQRMMLFDLVDFARNPYPLHLAPMGYVKEARWMARRARQLEPAWRDHLQATRQTIEESVHLCAEHGTVVVAGSGALSDVPIDLLCDAFDKVILLDIFHTRATRRAARTRPNVELIAVDVTGVAKPVFAVARRRNGGVLPKSIPPVLNTRPVDLIVSVNLLSQLAVLPCAFLKGHCPAIPAARLNTFARDLIDTHLQWLVQSAERVCLVADVCRREEMLHGAVIRKNIVADVDLPPPDKTWDWRIAPQGSVYGDRSVSHRVCAYRDFRLLDGGFQLGI